MGVTSIKHSPVMASEIHGDDAGLTSRWEVRPRVKDWINRLHGANTGKAVAELEVRCSCNSSGRDCWDPLEGFVLLHNYLPVLLYKFVHMYSRRQRSNSLSGA